MSLVALGREALPGSDRGSRGWPWLIFLVLPLLAGMVIVGSCTFSDKQEAEEARKVVEEYLSAVQTGDMNRARSYWTDINNPGGTWTMVPQRDMEHVIQEHRAAFAGGVRDHELTVPDYSRNETTNSCVEFGHWSTARGQNKEVGDRVGQTPRTLVHILHIPGCLPTLTVYCTANLPRYKEP